MCYQNVLQIAYWWCDKHDVMELIALVVVSPLVEREERDKVLQ